MKVQKKGNENWKGRNSSHRNKEWNKSQQAQSLGCCKDKKQANPLARLNKKKNKAQISYVRYEKNP